MICPYCGASAPEEAQFCPKCGQRIGGTESTAPVGAAAAVAPPSAVPLGRRRVVDVPEQVLWEGGISPKAMWGTWLTASVGSLVALGIAAYLLTHDKTLAGGVLIAVVAVLWVVLALYFMQLRMGLHFKLTNQRFFHEHGILRRTVDRIEVIEIEDLAYEQGLLDRMLGTGRIKITSGDRSNPVLWLNGIENVQHVFGLIDQARRAERLRRSVSIESIGGGDMSGAN